MLTILTPYAASRPALSAPRGADGTSRPGVHCCKSKRAASASSVAGLPSCSKIAVRVSAPGAVAVAFHQVEVVVMSQRSTPYLSPGFPHFARNWDRHPSMSRPCPAQGRSYDRTNNKQSDMARPISRCPASNFVALSRIQTRGPKVGRCNICGTSGPLTEDHTPPKGCYPPTAVELHSLVTRLNRDADGVSKRRLSQNGVKFRTLCGRCNSGLLGTEYDPALIRFVGTLRQALQSTLHLPPVLSVECQPQAVMRAVLGHMMAQGLDRYLKGPLTEYIRDYMLDRSLPLPTGL